MTTFWKNLKITLSSAADKSWRTRWDRDTNKNPESKYGLSRNRAGGHNSYVRALIYVLGDDEWEETAISSDFDP